MPIINPSVPSHHAEQPTQANDAQPFDELKLTSQEVDAKIKDLKEKGHFTIPIAPATKRLFEGNSQDGR